MKNVYIITHNNIDSYVPVVNYYLLEHYDTYGKNRDQWHWHDTIFNLTFEEADQQYFQTSPPDVIGLSVYIWNRVELFDFAKQVKEKYPQCLVVAGGPQPEYEFLDDFWQTNSYIDFVVPNQGEHVFTDFLDRVVDGTHLQTQEIVYYNYDNNQLIKNPTISKQPTKVWESAWVLKYHHLFEKDVDRVREHGDPYLLYETTRGCPYGCVYCDWGGGTYSKVRKKPLDIIKQELEILVKLKPHLLKIADANFGIVEMDVEIAKHIVDLKEKYGYPKRLAFDAPKNDGDRLERIYEIVIPAKLLNRGHLSLQDNNEEVLLAIDRKNIHWETQVGMARRLGEKYNFPFYTDLLLGLPGQTPSTWKQTLLDLSTTTIVMSINHLQVLPNSPMAKADYRDRYQIRWKYLNFGQDFMYEPRTVEDAVWLRQHGISTSIIEKNNPDSCLVVGSFSYNEDDLAVMTVTNGIFAGAIVTQSGYFKYFHDICNIYNIEIKHFHKVVSDLLVSEVIAPTTELGKQLQKIKNHTRDFLLGKVTKRSIDFGEEWHLRLNPELAVKYLLYKNPTDVYEIAKQALKDQVPEELLDYTKKQQSHCWLDFSYNPDAGRQWQGLDFEKLKQDRNNIQLVEYSLQQKEIQLAYNHSAEINWHRVPNADETFVFNTCMDNSAVIVTSPEIK